MELRQIQEPLRARYRAEPEAALITLSAPGLTKPRPPWLAPLTSAGLFMRPRRMQELAGRGRRGLFGRPAPGDAGRLRPDHLPNGSRRQRSPHR